VSAVGYTLPKIRQQVAMPYGMCVGRWLCPTECRQVTMPTNHASAVGYSLPRIHQQVTMYTHPPKLFRQFTFTYWGISAKVWACAKSVLVIYHSQPRHAGRCIHTHRNYFGNLPSPTGACRQRYGHVLKVFW